MKKIKIEILWEDTTHFEGWWDDEEIERFIDIDPEEAYYYTVGYLLNESEDFLLVAMSIKKKHDKDNAYGDIYRFPKSQIREVRILEEDGNRRETDPDV